MEALQYRNQLHHQHQLAELRRARAAGATVVRRRGIDLDLLRQPEAGAGQDARLVDFVAEAFRRQRLGNSLLAALASWALCCPLMGWSGRAPGPQR